VTTFITVPCFNEAARWDHGYWREISAAPGIEFVFVDDGSRDNTRKLAQDICASTSSHLLTQDDNRGKAEAVRTGLLWTLERVESTDVVGFMDADGALRNYDLDRLIEVCDAKFQEEAWDAVWSSRVALAGRHIRRSARRHYLGRIAATLLFGTRDDTPYDTQSGLKFFRPSNDLASMLATPFRTRWLFEVELMHRYEFQLGRHLSIWEEPLMFWNEVPGSKIKGSELVRAAGEILTIKRMYWERGR